MTVLTIVSWFVIAAGSWLSVMENILRHDGFARRRAGAGAWVAQPAARFPCAPRDLRSEVRYLVLPGALAFLMLGCSAIARTLQAEHFEGFVLIIGLALVLQGGISLAGLSGLRSSVIRSSLRDAPPSMHTPSESPRSSPPNQAR